MIKYRFLRGSKQWAVVGEVDEIHLGPIEVTDKFGHTKTERVIKVTNSFPGNDGKILCYGIIAPLPRGTVCR